MNFGFMDAILLQSGRKQVPENGIVFV